MKHNKFVNDRLRLDKYLRTCPLQRRYESENQIRNLELI